jgi:glycosyltransferase involved in cell wall biosynthesis
MNHPLLTILIPTIGRIADLTIALEAFIVSIQRNAMDDGQVEIVVADNQSHDATATVVQELSQRVPFVRYHRHETFRTTAEDSILNAIEWCRGDYVWTFGDDDCPLPDAIETVTRVLTERHPEFLLINMNCIQGLHSVLGWVSDSDRFYSRGSEMFKDLGFTGASACISSYCIHRTLLDFEFFKKISNISPVYSVSFFLFCTLFHRNTAVLATPIFHYRINQSDQEFNRISNVYIRQGQLPYSAWHLGLLRLMTFASAYSDIPLSELMEFKESMTAGVGSGQELSRHYVPLREFIAIYIDHELDRPFAEISADRDTILLFLTQFAETYHTLGKPYSKLSDQLIQIRDDIATLAVQPQDGWLNATVKYYRYSIRKRLRWPRIRALTSEIHP